MTPSVTRAEVEELARAMSWKLGCHGSPTGGSKGGIRVQPSDPDTPRLLNHYGEQVAHWLQESVVLGKDMGATDALIDGMYRHLGFSQLAPIGSSSLTQLREFEGYRKHMTGLGVAFASRAACGGSLQGVRVAIQGSGLVGLGAALRLSEEGARVVGMSDIDRALFWPNGLPLDEVQKYAAGHRDLRDIESGEAGPRDSLFETEADVLILAASSYSVTEEAVNQIRAPLVVEAGNMAFQPAARTRIHARGIEVIPDVIASSSSAAMVSRQLAAGGKLSERDLWSAIEESICNAVLKHRQSARRSRKTIRDEYVTWVESRTIVQDSLRSDVSDGTM